jgi:hypothetical protein
VGVGVAEGEGLPIGGRSPLPVGEGWRLFRCSANVVQCSAAQESRSSARLESRSTTAESSPRRSHASRDGRATT